MSWGEAIRLTEILLVDPSSMLAAVREQWKYPVTRAEAVLMDLYDLEHRVNSRTKPQPYQRPWETRQKRQRGKTDMTRQQVVAVLNQFGHSI